MSLTTDTIILGINAYHGDSSACILVNGELIAAIEEERFGLERGPGSGVAPP